MRMSMTCKDYIGLLKGYSNIPLTLNRITLPFGIISDNAESTSLLVGHVLDEIFSNRPGDEVIDCIDVLAAAYELGHEAAGTFLDQAPYLMYRMAKEAGAGRVH